MGTDIHVQLEKRRADGSWERVKKPNFYYCYESMGGCAVGDTIGVEPCCDKAQGWSGWGIQRNYSLFAILADVRNGYGFAGCDTGDGFNVIASQRGLPKDMSASVGKNHDSDSNDWLGDHSFSWLTLREIIDFDWEQKAIMRGWVGPTNYQVFKDKGSPDSWSGMVSGKHVEYVSNSEMEQLIAQSINQNENDTSKHAYTQISWGNTYRELTEWFHDTVLKYMLRFGTPDELRIVFGFDS